MDSKPTIDKLTWINPLGGLGDTLMLSGVLKRHHDTHPDIKYNLVRRTKYVSILKGHPAIDKIGFPPKSAKIIGSDYWAHPLFNEHIHACNVLAMIFNLAPDPEKKMYLPEEAPSIPYLTKAYHGSISIFLLPLHRILQGSSGH